MPRREKVIRVESWNELQEWLFEDSWKPSLKRFRSNYAFRGCGNDLDDLQTALMTLGGNYAVLENHLIRNFIKYAGSESTPGDSIWHWLAVGQHHGLPTRLLDWTYSPFVALHFATKDMNSFHVDGAIWCLDYTKSNQFLPKKLKRLLKEEGSYVFTAELLSRAAKSLQEFDKLEKDDFVVFYEPPSLDERIVNQFALFSMMSSPKANLHGWLQKKPDLHRKLLIPASLKREIRDKLDQANITERVLFPGLDGLSAWLRRYYSPKI